MSLYGILLHLTPSLDSFCIYNLHIRRQRYFVLIAVGKVDVLRITGEIILDGNLRYFARKPCLPARTTFQACVYEDYIYRI